MGVQLLVTNGQIWLFLLCSVKELLRQHEQNVTPLSQEGEYRTPRADEKNFSFSIFFL